jgi:hypothetical protein
MTAMPHRAKLMAQRWAVTVVCLSGVALLTACGSSVTSGTASASASASAIGGSASPSSAAIRCGQVTMLGTSLTKLGHAAVSLESLGQIAADLANVDQHLATLKDQTTLAFSAHKSQLTAAVDEIGKDARALAGHPSQANLNALAAAVNNLKSAAKPVIKEIDAACPSN